MVYYDVLSCRFVAGKRGEKVRVFGEFRFVVKEKKKTKKEINKKKNKRRRTDDDESNRNHLPFLSCPLFHFSSLILPSSRDGFVWKPCSSSNPLDPHSLQPFDELFV